MLLRFGVANHRSVRDYQEIYLSACKRIKRKGLVIPVPILKEATVPVVAFYGGNATGKSNLIDAMNHFQRAIVLSHKSSSASERIPRDPFRLDESSHEEPTRFDCTFTCPQGSVDDPENQPSEYVYEYGFEYVDSEFRREWLLRIARKERQSTQMLFERRTEDGQVRATFGSQLRGENRTILSLTRPNSLLLSAGAQNNHPLFTELYRYFAEQWNVLGDARVMQDTEVAMRLSDNDHMESLLSLVRQADIGIIHIGTEDDEPDEEHEEFTRDLVSLIRKHLGDSKVEESGWTELMLHRKRLRFLHTAVGKRNVAFGFDSESKGTQTLISMLIPALEALARGSLLVFDELDTSLHPSLARAFVSLFLKRDSNPLGAQLIFSTHDVALLGSGLLDHDEVWMVDKILQGETRLTPLTEFKLRSRDDIEKAYRLGRFGGVPVSEDFFLEIGQSERTAAQ